MNTDDPARWFRLYAEFATDPKVQILSEKDQRRFIMLMCIRCGNGMKHFSAFQLAFQLRISETELEQTKTVLMTAGLIDSNYQPVQWDKRQFAHDKSTERVRRFRDRKRSETVSETSPENRDRVQSTEKPKTIVQQKTLDVIAPEDFLQFWNQYPRHEGKVKALSKWKGMNLADRLLAYAGIQRWKDSGRWDDEQFVPLATTYLNGRRWEDEIKGRGNGKQTDAERIKSTVDKVAEKYLARVVPASRPQGVERAGDGGLAATVRTRPS